MKRELDGHKVAQINPDLTSVMDLTKAQTLAENCGIAFIGTQKGGAFDISYEQAEAFLRQTGNPSQRPNSDVIHPWINGKDITGNPRNMWIIDFGVDATEETASLYESPFEYIKTRVKRQREEVNSEQNTTTKWWLFQRPRPEMREALNGLTRYIATPRVSKHRLFVWVKSETITDSAAVTIARSDDYCFGVLHSKPHELWALRQGTSLEDRPRYTPTTCFETFPFPWAPGTEPAEDADARVAAIAEAARELVAKRDAWLNPPGASEAELKKRTLTTLYNQRPTWLTQAHARLDRAVFEAYGWGDGLSDEEILERLLALNLERAGVGRR